jgi:hypothetical protein
LEFPLNIYYTVPEEIGKNNGNGYVEVNGLKGIWTLNEVVGLLQSHGLKVKISMLTKADYRIASGHESANSKLEEVK